MPTTPIGVRKRRDVSVHGERDDPAPAIQRACEGSCSSSLARRCCDLRPSKIGLAARSKDTGGELGRFALGGGRETKNKSGTQAGPRSFIMVVCACVRQRRAALGPHT
ncbi:hypothetical protein MRX96_047608 [Rhipicephalus microplus]